MLIFEFFAPSTIQWFHFSFDQTLLRARAKKKLCFRYLCFIIYFMLFILLSGNYTAAAVEEKGRGGAGAKEAGLSIRIFQTRSAESVGAEIKIMVFSALDSSSDNHYHHSSTRKFFGGNISWNHSSGFAEQNSTVFYRSDLPWM